MSAVANRGHRLHRLLINELASAGCFKPAPVRALAYGTFVLGGYACAYAGLLAAPGWGLRVLCLVALAFFCVHAAFIAHETGHGALTRDRRLAQCIGQVFNTLLTALCYSYFSHIHRAHHPHCNDRGRDPDMQSDLLQLVRAVGGAKARPGRLLSRHQAVLIWILVSLQGLTFKLESLQYLRRNPRTTRIDQAVLALHAFLWLVPPTIVLGLGDALVNYALMTWLIGPYTGAIFLVNHVGTRVIEPDEELPFFAQEIAVTRNLGSSRLHDFLFGGINNHIEHHLFPSMPTARLPQASASRASSASATASPIARCPGLRRRAK